MQIGPLTYLYPKKNCPLCTFTSYIPSVSFSIAWKLSGGLLSEKEQLSHKLKDCTQELWRVADHPNTFQRNPKIPGVYFMIIDLWLKWIWYLNRFKMSSTWSWDVHFFSHFIKWNERPPTLKSWYFEASKDLITKFRSQALHIK